MAGKPESTAGRAANDLGQPEADEAGATPTTRKAGEGTREARSPSDPPPAGPHADPALQNPDATPGAGALPSADEQGDEAEAASG